jgi:hypothetical protein
MSDETNASPQEPDKPTAPHEGFLGHVEHAAEEVEQALQHDKAAKDELNRQPFQPAEPATPDDAASKPAVVTDAPDSAKSDNTPAKPDNTDKPVLDADNAFKPEPEHPSDNPAATIPPINEQPDPTKVADKLDDPGQQRDPLLQIAKNKFIAHQDYEATTTVCPVCQAEFNPGAPVL